MKRRKDEEERDVEMKNIGEWRKGVKEVERKG